MKLQKWFNDWRVQTFITAICLINFVAIVWEYTRYDFYPTTSVHSSTIEPLSQDFMIVRDWQKKSNSMMFLNSSITELCIPATFVRSNGQLIRENHCISFKEFEQIVKERTK